MNMPNNFEPDVIRMTGSIIKVIGVGGGGSNAVNHMFRQGIEGVEFFVCNTDAQALIDSPVPNKLQLGIQLTEGLGAGSEPEQGRKAAIESVGQITDIMRNNTKMVFITAGMGGGTGTGAAPVVAKIAKELGVLTVGIVTLPFEDEGPERNAQAQKGINDMKPHVDALLTICNDRIVDMFGDLVVSEAFSKADDILCTAAKGIAEIITKPGKLNVDFKDVMTAMTNSGRAIMGTGISKGTDRADEAVRKALDSPLLDNTRIIGAKHLLVNFTYGTAEPKLSETSLVKKFLQNEAGHTAHLKMGITHDERLGEEIAITVIATGFEMVQNNMEKMRVIGTLEETGQEHVNDATNGIPETPQPFLESDNDRIEENFIEILADTKIEKLRSTREKELENMSIPAYLRRNVQLVQAPSSNSNNVARHQIAEIKDDSELQVQKNKFLHDNVD
jgi:cell division protein FtsZ